MQIDAQSNISIRRERLALEDRESNRCDEVLGAAERRTSPHREGNPLDVRFPPDSGLGAAQLTSYDGRFTPSRQSLQLPQICRSPALPLASLLIVLLSADH